MISPVRLVFFPSFCLLISVQGLQTQRKATFRSRPCGLALNQKLGFHKSYKPTATSFSLQRRAQVWTKLDPFQAHLIAELQKKLPPHLQGHKQSKGIEIHKKPEKQRPGMDEVGWKISVLKMEQTLSLYETLFKEGFIA